MATTSARKRSCARCHGSGAFYVSDRNWCTVRCDCGAHMKHDPVTVQITACCLFIGLAGTAALLW